MDDSTLPWRMHHVNLSLLSRFTKVACPARLPISRRRAAVVQPRRPCFANCFGLALSEADTMHMLPGQTLIQSSCRSPCFCNIAAYSLLLVNRNATRVFGFPVWRSRRGFRVATVVRTFLVVGWPLSVVLCRVRSATAPPVKSTTLHDLGSRRLRGQSPVPYKAKHDAYPTFSHHDD